LITNPLQQKVMSSLPKKWYGLHTTFFILLLCFIFNSNPLHSQSEILLKHIQNSLERIDVQLQEKEYAKVLVKVEELESYKAYVSVVENRLSLNLIKAKALYGNDNQEESIKLLLNGLDELEINSNLPLQKVKYSKFIGEIFEKANNFDKALIYFKKSLESANKINDTLEILNAYLNVGNTFFNKKVNNSTFYFFDSAKYYFHKIEQFPINEKTKEIISKSYTGLGNINLEIDSLNLAEKYAEEALKIKQSLKDTLETAVAILNLSGIYFKKKEYAKAINNYRMAYESVKDMESDRALNVKEFSLYNIAWSLAELGNYKEAYQSLDEGSILTNIINNNNSARNISEIAAKYNVAKEAQKLEVEKNLRLRTQVFLYGLGIAFLVILVFGYIFYNNYRLKQRNKLELIENEMNTRIINATIDAKEKERKTIAEILHDSVSALLSSVNLHLQASKAQLRIETPKEITKAQVILNEASIKIRDLSHELISSVLLKFGLAFAVHDMCQKYSNSEITLFSDDNGVKRYDQDFEIKIHNIIEELINNILKHSKASNATIMLTHRKDDKLAIRINDDGIGFNVESVRKKNGLGLSHINARVKIMKGEFTIESSKDEGTSIFILVPITLKELEV